MGWADSPKLLYWTWLFGAADETFTLRDATMGGVAQSWTVDRRRYPDLLRVQHRHRCPARSGLV